MSNKLASTYEGLGLLYAGLCRIEEASMAGASKVLAERLTNLIETAQAMRQQFGAETCSECLGEGWQFMTRCRCGGTGRMPVGGWTK